MTSEKLNQQLIEAASRNNSEEVKLLLNKGANINGTDFYGKTALINAVQKNSVNAIKVLVDYGANIKHASKFGLTATIEALRLKNISALKIFLAHISPDHFLDLMIPHYYDNIDFLRYLIKAGANVAGKNGNEVLRLAVHNNRLNIAKLLLTNGANAINDNSLLYAAAAKNNIEMMALLISAGANINQAENSNIQTPLFAAMKNVNMEAVKYLLRLGANVNAIDRFGDTPLSTTPYGYLNYEHENNLQLVKLLIAAGAKLNISPVLANAVYHGHPNIVEYLLNQNADANFTSRDGNTALMMACNIENLTIARTLTNAGANINAKNKYGEMPLIIAIKQGNTAMVKLLIEAGANVGPKGPTNITADNFRSINIKTILRAIKQKKIIDDIH